MKTIILEIANVPEVESVLNEIKQNAETTIRNYWDKEIRVVSEEKELEFKAKVDMFRADNFMDVAVEAMEKPIIKDTKIMI
jgi:hypothetical protein